MSTTPQYQPHPDLNAAGLPPGKITPIGMLTQTGAMLLDSYREIQSRRLFWITLVLSAIVVAAFGAVGFNDQGFTIFWKQINSRLINTRLVPAAELYKGLFVSLGVQWWLSWLAIILALVSTAPMIPDFLSGGAIDLYLARPLGRVRLFLTKYVAGLLFVGLQVGVFCAACFVVIGLRAGVWLPGIFAAVPLVVLLFSYLWSVCALVGLITRSTVASLLLTLLAWFAFFGLHATESTLLFFSVGTKVELRDLDRQIARHSRDVASLSTRPSATQPEHFDSKRLPAARLALEAAEERRASVSGSTLEGWHRAFAAIKYPFPKTAETSALMERVLNKQFRPPNGRNDEEETETTEGNSVVRGITENPRLQREVGIEVNRIVRARSLWYVLGTSITFELVVLALCCWIFVRRDF